MDMETDVCVRFLGGSKYTTNINLQVSSPSTSRSWWILIMLTTPDELLVFLRDEPAGSYWASV